MNYVLPVIFILIILYAFYKKTSVYDGFVGGAKDSVKMIFSILPYLITVCIMIEVFRSSGLSDLMVKTFSPLMTFLGIPPELSELIILRPFSGSGSIALIEDIYKTYSPDSYVARVASVIIGSSDTVFYIAVVYFCKTKIKNLRYGIPVCLIATFVGTITACLICRYI